MKQKLEFICECGRSYIIFGTSNTKPRKCKRCGRLMLPLKTDLKAEAFKTANNTKQQDEASPSKPKQDTKTPLSNLDETWEYQYKFDHSAQSESFTFWKLLKRIFSLFSRGKSPRR